MTLTRARALSWIRRIEGGFSDHASDPGGATYAGVALRTVRGLDADGDGVRDFDLDGDGDVDAADIRALAGHPAKVEAFYVDRYWTPTRADELPPHLALFTFDAAVHHGVGAAALLLQRAVGAKPDGAIGPDTIARVQHAWNTALEAALTERAQLFHAIVARRPASAVFLRGWHRRLFALQSEAVYLVRDLAVRDIAGQGAR